MSHHEIGRETRSCTKHGDYESVRWCLDEFPSPRDKEGRIRLAAVNPSEPWVGLPDYLHPFWGSCPSCDAVLQAEADENDAMIRGGGTAKQMAMLRRQQEANVPPRFSRCTLDNWLASMPKQQKIRDWAREFCSSFDLVLETGRCGAFVGDPGTGKTHLAIAIMHHVLSKGGTGYYTTVMDLLGRIKSTYHKDSPETEAKVVAAVTGVDILVIDEVGRQLDSNYEQAQFFRIMDIRYRHLRPVILISNLRRVEFAKFLGAAAVDRMQESGGKLLEFDWASSRDYRKPKEGDEE